MPLVTSPTEVEEIYAEVAERGACLAGFCTANQYTTEAILRSAHLFAQQHGLKAPPIIVSATANYHIEPQLQAYTSLRDARLGLRALIDDVENLVSEESPFNCLRVMLHLDHAQPRSDSEIIPRVLGRFATILYDCSYLPMEENIRLTARFVEEHRRQIRVEGVLTEIVQAMSDEERRALSDPDEAERFVRETGVFLLAPDVGTEHRATGAVARYNPEAAQAISRRIGKRLVLHGSSSLHDSDLGRLAGDGFIKVNIWTIFERLGGQALSDFVAQNVGNILPEERLEVLKQEGYLGSRWFDETFIKEACEGRLGPKYSFLLERVRRDVWLEAVVNRMVFYLDAFNYARLT
jgi:fructose/tagatose bisphosphate aldolase